MLSKNRVIILNDGTSLDLRKIKWGAFRRDPYAMFLLGELYFTGQGVGRNLKKSIRWLTRSVDKGNTNAMYVLSMAAREYDDEQLHSRIHEMLLESAEQGCPLSMRQLGTDYHNGDYVERDLYASRDWLTKALEADCPDTRFFLGHIYFFAEEEDLRDRDRGLELLKIDSDEGNAEASYVLAMIYREGMVSEPNQFLYTKYIHKAGDQGSGIANLIYGDMMMEGSAYVEMDREGAYLRYRTALDQGCEAATANIGMCHMFGLGTEQDNALALEYLQRGVEADSVAAMNNLAMMYANGVGVEKDGAYAVELYRMAVEKGSMNALVNLAVMYAMGNGVEQDVAKAEELLTEAAEAGIPNAQMNLEALRNGAQTTRNVISFSNGKIKGVSVEERDEE